MIIAARHKTRRKLMSSNSNQLVDIIAEVENLLRENMEFMESTLGYLPINDSPMRKQCEYLIRKNKMYMGVSEDE